MSFISLFSLCEVGVRGTSLSSFSDINNSSFCALKLSQVRVQCCYASPCVKWHCCALHHEELCCLVGFTSSRTMGSKRNRAKRVRRRFSGNHFVARAVFCSTSEDSTPASCSGIVAASASGKKLGDGLSSWFLEEGEVSSSSSSSCPRTQIVM